MFGTSTRYGEKIPPPPDVGHQTLTLPEERQVRSKLKAAAYGMKGVNWHKLFRHYDRDNTGELGFVEFKRAIRGDAKISVSTLPNSQVRHLFNSIDLDSGGTIDVEEFIEWVETEDNETESARKLKNRRRRKKSSGYGRTSPHAMSSPSQRRFDYQSARFINNNHEHSEADGAEMLSFDDGIENAIENATIALQIPSPNRFVMSERKSKKKIQREKSNDTTKDIIDYLKNNASIYDDDFEDEDADAATLAKKKLMSSSKSIKSAFVKVNTKRRNKNQNQKKAQPGQSSPLVSRLKREKDAQDSLIHSQAEQLKVLKMLVNQQFDALSPAQNKMHTQLFDCEEEDKDAKSNSNSNSNDKRVETDQKTIKESITFTCRCHCGANVGRFECNENNVRCWECNCSDCAMRKNLHFVIPKSKFQIEKGGTKKTTTEYIWGTGVANRKFCKICGILPWYTPRSNPDGIGITLGCVDWGNGARPSISIEKFDGIHWDQSMNETNIREESKEYTVGGTRSPSRGSTYSSHSADHVEL